MEAEIFDSLVTVPAFALYFLVSAGLLCAFSVIYAIVTPYSEMALIRSGNTAAAISLGGSLLGFVIAIASVIIHSVSLIDLMIWGIIALIVQIGVYFSVRLVIRDIAKHIEEGSVAQASFLAMYSICLGILNGVCMVP